jgi:hypothetical protein
MRTVLLKNASGGVRGNLELSTGRIYNDAGNLVEQLTPMGNHDEALADYASAYYHSNIARQVGRPVTMTDREGDERLVTMDLSTSDVHTDAALPNYAAGYKLAAGVADLACPAFVNDKQSNKFNTWDSDNAFRRVLPTGSAPGGAIPEINPTLSQGSYNTVEYALGAFVKTEVQTNADAPLRPYQAAVKRVLNALLLEREIRVATLMRTSGNWDAAMVQTLISTTKWNGGASSDPVANIHAAIEASFMEITGIIMSEQVAHDFQRNPNTQKYIAYKSSAAPLPNASQFGALLDLPPIHVAKMKYFASGSTQSYVWGGDVVLVHSPAQNPPTDQEDVATAYTFRWNGGDTPDGAMSGGFLVRTFWDPKRGGRGGQTVVVVHNDAEVMTSKVVGGLILNAHS